MESARFEALMIRGGNIVRHSRSVCADSLMHMQQAIRHCADIAHAMRKPGGVPHGVPHGEVLPGAPVLRQFLEQSADPYETAKAMIDRHGRWARHVTLERAIAMGMAPDHDGEQFWRAVFVAVLELQTPRVTKKALLF
jgi:hypothetical protein